MKIILNEINMLYAYHIIFWEYSLIIKKKPRLQFMEIFILDNEAVPLISI